MEEISSLWRYELGVDEMRLKFLYAALEFERFKAETIEESRKKNEYICQLIQLLKDVSQERDEARNQLRKLINIVSPSSPNPSELISNFPLVQNESPFLLKPTKASNPSITESKCLSEAIVNNNSHGLSCFDSFVDVVSAPDLSHINMAAPNNNNSNLKVSLEMPKVDNATSIIDNLIKGKPLPEKGKFVQAILDAPQLPKSVFLARPAPNWNNPPWFHASQIPQLSKHKETEVVQQNSMTNLTCGGSQESQKSTSPLFNFSTTTATCMGASNVGSAGGNLNNFFPSAKRQML